MPKLVLEYSQEEVSRLIADDARRRYGAACALTVSFLENGGFVAVTFANVDPVNLQGKAGDVPPAQVKEAIPARAQVKWPPPEAPKEPPCTTQEHPKINGAKPEPEMEPAETKLWGSNPTTVLVDDVAAAAEPKCADAVEDDRLPASHPISKDERTKMRVMLRNGRSNKDIADALNRDYRGFHHMVKRERAMLEAEDRAKESIEDAKTARQDTETAAPEAVAQPSPAPATATHGPETAKGGSANPKPIFEKAPPLGVLATPEQRVNYRLDQLGYEGPWSPTNDLALVKALAMGRKISDVAAGLDVTQAEAKARYINLLPEGDLDEQTQMLRILRARAETASEAAA